MTVVERRDILADHIQRSTGRTPSSPIHRVRVTHRDHLRVFLVHRCVENETRAVDRVIALNDLTFVINKDQIRHPNLREMNTHRIRPIELRKLGVTNRQVPSKPIIETVVVERPAGRDQMFFSVLTVISDLIKHRGLGEDQVLLIRLVEGNFFSGCTLSGHNVLRYRVLRTLLSYYTSV